MRAFFDTNVVLDDLQRREPFFAESYAAMKRCVEVRGAVVSALTFATAVYIMDKAIGHAAARDLISDFRKSVEVSAMSAESVDWAILTKARDFEDAMQYESAVSARADVIVTRDVAGFADSKIRVVTPAQFVKESCA